MSISLCHSSNLYLFLNVYRVNRDSDKMIFERLQKEFEAARASQTEGRFELNVSSFFNQLTVNSIWLCVDSCFFPIHFLSYILV